MDRPEIQIALPPLPSETIPLTGRWLASVFPAIYALMRNCAEAINDILRGRSNAITTVTLTANAATTTLTYRHISPTSRFVMSPTTANGAAALTNVYFSTPGNGSVVINHANNAQTDRSFNVAIIG